MASNCYPWLRSTREPCYDSLFDQGAARKENSNVIRQSNGKPLHYRL